MSWALHLRKWQSTIIKGVVLLNIFYRSYGMADPVFLLSDHTYVFPTCILLLFPPCVAEDRGGKVSQHCISNKNSDHTERKEIGNKYKLFYFTFEQLNV